MITQPHRSEAVVTIDRRTEQTMRAWIDDITEQVNSLLSSGGGGGGGSTDHGTLTGLSDDDHSQYHNNARGDARYYTKTLLDSGQLDSRYYTEAEVSSFLAGKANTSHNHTALNVTDFSESVDDRVAALVVAGTNMTITYNDGAGTLTFDAASGSLTEAEIDFGITPTRSKKFLIADGSVTVTSKITVMPSGNIGTGRVGDDWEWDSISFAAKAGIGSFTITALASGRIRGNRKIFYSVG